MVRHSVLDQIAERSLALGLLAGIPVGKRLANGRYYVSISSLKSFKTLCLSPGKAVEVN